jgi:hypothetical protein
MVTLSMYMDKRNWLKHYATSLKVSGLSPDEVDISNYVILVAILWPWGSTHPLTEMSTGNLHGG